MSTTDWRHPKYRTVSSVELFLVFPSAWLAGARSCLLSSQLFAGIIFYSFCFPKTFHQSASHPQPSRGLFTLRYERSGRGTIRPSVPHCWKYLLKHQWSWTRFLDSPFLSASISSSGSLHTHIENESNPLITSRVVLSHTTVYGVVAIGMYKWGSGVSSEMMPLPFVRMNLRIIRDVHLERSDWTGALQGTRGKMFQFWCFCSHITDDSKRIAARKV